MGETMKKRLISGILLALIFIGFYFLDSKYFIILTTLLSVLMYKEIISLKKYPLPVIILGLISIVSIIIFNQNIYDTILKVKYYPLIFTFVSLLIPTLIPKYQDSYLTSDAFSLSAMIIFIGLSLCSFTLFNTYNKPILLYLVSCVIFNDIFAFLIGSKFGKTKYSKISPNKSLEGNIAGISFGLVFGFLAYYFLVSKERVIITIIITLLLNIACQIGDLLFSKIKREHNIKDFSNLIPGHGGILDRFDSLLLTTLVYALIIAII